VSIGVSVFPEDGEDADALLRQSDGALYQAKEEGRDAVRLA
jgi:diguanylate cyclase (GGDEF)-like protein